MDTEKPSSEKGKFLTQIMRLWGFGRLEFDLGTNGGSCQVLKKEEICQPFSSLYLAQWKEEITARNTTIECYPMKMLRFCLCNTEFLNVGGKYDLS